MASSCTKGDSSWILGGKKVFLEIVVKHWNRLPREVVESLFLEILKKYVDVSMRETWFSGYGEDGLTVRSDDRGLCQP